MITLKIFVCDCEMGTQSFYTYEKDTYSNIILQVLAILMLSGYVAGNDTSVLEEALNSNLLAAFLLVTSLLVFSPQSCKCISFPFNS